MYKGGGGAEHLRGARPCLAKVRKHFVDQGTYTTLTYPSYHTIYT